MFVAARRLMLLAFLGAASYAGWMALQNRRRPAPDGADASSPGGSPAAAPATAAVQSVSRPASPAGPTPTQLWAEPVDGACPHGYPIKANANSGIYHVPGGRFYERTVPERCYADTADAEADGYRRSKA